MDMKDYFRTIFENKLMVKMPEREDEHLTPATKLLEKRREMLEVENALAVEKEEFQLKVESLNQRKQDLEKKEVQLKESVIKFDKFLKENDAKLSRAVKKAEDERELQKVKQKEIERLKEETKKQTKLKEKYIKKVANYQKYNKFLERTVESTDEFQEIREIIDRYETLTVNYKDLRDIQNDNEESVNQKRRDLNTYQNNKNYQVLNMNNELSDLQMALDEAQNKTHKAENEWNHIQSTAAGKTLLIGEIRMAIRNLYDLVVSHHQKKDADVDEDLTADEQLKRVQEFVNDLVKITTELQREQLVQQDSTVAS